MYPYLRAQRMCTQCLTIFSRPNPPLSAPCPHCDTAHFCNRVCLSRAQASASHHDLLCPGQNPAAKGLLKLVQQQGARHLDAVAKIIALWRGERELGRKGKAKELEQRVWHGMARINQETKEAERREWCVFGGRWASLTSQVVCRGKPTSGVESSARAGDPGAEPRTGGYQLQDLPEVDWGLETIEARAVIRRGGEEVVLLRELPGASWHSRDQPRSLGRAVCIARSPQPLLRAQPPGESHKENAH
jgi:hypothetical protein